MPQFVTPVAGRLTQPFIDGKHLGVDIGAVDHSTVVAAESGRVIFEGIWGAGGNTIIIKGNDGWETYYCHLSKFIANMGVTVMQGQAIAQSGGALGEQGAGNARGAHLHFEIHTPNGVAINPQIYISVGGAAMGELPVQTQGVNVPGVVAGSIGNSIKHLILPWTQVTDNKMLSGAAKDIPGVGTVLTTAEATGLAANFLTSKKNWIRIGEFTAGAAILVLVFSKTLGQTQAVQSLTKVAAVAA